MEGKVDDSAKTEIEAAIADVRSVLESEDVYEIRSKTEALQQAFHKVSEQIYAAAAQQQADTQQNGDAPTGESEEEVVDAEVVDDKEQK
jgi:molecular chaperone DnaK